MGTAMGAVAGGYLMLATLWLVIKGGPNPGETLELLGQYFIGFTVTLPGAFIGLLYGFLWGFILGKPAALVFVVLRQCCSERRQLQAT